MANSCKYYRERKYVSYDSGVTWSPLNEYRRGDLYEEDSADCGYVIQYRWQVISGYTCVGCTKYQTTQKFQSTDNGQTWTEVIPTEYGLGNVIEYGSTDCGCSTQYRWVVVSEEYICSGTTKYTKEKKQVSYDGQTWSDVVPNETRTGEVIEYNSIDCGSKPPIYKWVVIEDEYECVGVDKYEKTQKYISYDDGISFSAVTPAEYGIGELIQVSSVDCGGTIMYRWIPTSSITCTDITSNNMNVSFTSNRYNYFNTPCCFTNRGTYYTASLYDLENGRSSGQPHMIITVKSSIYDHYYIDLSMHKSTIIKKYVDGVYKGHIYAYVYADSDIAESTNQLIAVPNDDGQEHTLELHIAVPYKSSVPSGGLYNLTLYIPQTAIEYESYYLYKRQISYDSGNTWSDVIPEELVASGSPINDYSESACTEAYEPFTPNVKKIQLTSENGTIIHLNNDGLPLNGREVSYCIDYSVVANRHTVTNVEIGNCVKTINSGAFGQLNIVWDFEMFTIPEGVTTIKDNAFPYGNTYSPKYYTFPSSLTSFTLTNGAMNALIFNGTTPPSTLNIDPPYGTTYYRLEAIYVPCQSIELYKAKLSTREANKVKCLEEHPILYRYEDGVKQMSFTDGETWHNCYPQISRTVATSGYVCDGYNKYEEKMVQISTDNGVTWEDTGKLVSGDLIEANSEDCGYIPPTPPTPPTPADYSTQYFTLVPTTATSTFQFSQTGLSYSIDSGSTWTSLAANTNTPSVVAGHKIMFKGTITPTSNGIGTFTSSEKFDAEGNAMSLLYGNNFIGETSLSGKDYVFYFLFYQSSIVSAENLVLPATTLSTFCYGGMFANCSSLTTAPELPATTLAWYCYSGIFYGCTSLTIAPSLSATTLVNGCYYQMLRGCTSLNEITCLATDKSATDCTTNWLSGVASSGTFYKNPSMTSWGSGNSGIPNGWTVLDAT